MSIINVLYGEEEIQNRVRELAEEIQRVYSDRPITVIVILKGAIFFAADLLRCLSNPIDLQFVELESTGNGTPAGEVRIRYWSRDLNVEEKDVLIIEDVLDTGITLEFLIRRLEQMGARSIRVCCLLEKPARRRVNVQADFVAFVIKEVYVVGYGLHDRGRFRNLAYLAEVVSGNETI